MTHAYISVEQREKLGIKDSIVRFSIGIEYPDDESMYFVRLLSKKEGVLTGSSSGAAVAGAINQAYKAKWKINIVVILPDRSDRYFSQNLYDFSMNLSNFRFNALIDDWANGL